MTPPPRRYSSSSKAMKRVEFSPSLNSIDSEGPAMDEEAPGNNNPTGTWDAESSHFLSYLILGNEGAARVEAQGHQAPDFTTGRRPRRRSEDEQGPVGLNRKPPPSMPEEEEGSYSSESGMEPEPAPPPTPAIQFYAHPSSSHSSHQQQQQQQGLTTIDNSNPTTTAPGLMSSGSNSSSSLNSMTAVQAALVSGGPLVYQQMQLQQQQSSTAQQQQHQQPQRTNSTGTDSPALEGVSPISPAGLIGAGHENLMLPPPPRSRQGSNASRHRASPPEAGTNVQQHQQQHMAFINELNARAQAARAAAGAPDAALSAPQQPQPLIVPHPSGQGYVMAPPNSAAAILYNQAQAAAGGMPMSALPNKSQVSVPETKEKRAERLKRNAESARRSRRKKKDRLVHLEAKVNKLAGELDEERKQLIRSMMDGLADARLRSTIKLVEEKGDAASGMDLLPILRNTSASSAIALASVQFQYNTLRQMLFPRYLTFLLWFTIPDDSYFMAGKEQYASLAKPPPESSKSSTGKQGGKGSAGRGMSSKQIGEEISKGSLDAGPGMKPYTFNAMFDQQEGESDAGDELQDRASQTSHMNDAARMWPLLCFENKFSVDQEEKFVAAQKRLRQMPSLAQERAQMAAAQRTVKSLKEAVTSLCHVAARREEENFLQVLTPNQVASYQMWLVGNRERCRNALVQQQAITAQEVGKDTTLDEICSRLDQVLQISGRKYSR